ncbi:MAG TPA: hypothetical protein VHW74_15720 [Mycobacteriales bacterium]|jgi:hypothetical protein|nr:hypothetical protein [Mycobacteriales bacterium]
MKARLSTGLRVAAWSASSLLVVGAAAGTASAATHHAKHVKKHSTAKDTTTGTTPTTGTGTTGTGTARPTPPQMLHGTETVETTDGTFEVYANQVGTVSAVTATSITVVSADKFSATYVIDSSTKIVKNGATADATGVATGDTVMVQAEQDDAALTAIGIFDGKPTAGQGGQGGPGQGGPGGPGGHAGPPPAGQGPQGASESGSDS